MNLVKFPISKLAKITKSASSFYFETWNFKTFSFFFFFHSYFHLHGFDGGGSFSFGQGGGTALHLPHFFFGGGSQVPGGLTMLVTSLGGLNLPKEYAVPKAHATIIERNWSISGRALTFSGRGNASSRCLIRYAKCFLPVFRQRWAGLQALNILIELRRQEWM